MPRATPVRTSSFLRVAVLAVGVGSASLAVFACSSFDATASNAGDDGGPEAQAAEAASVADATADAATDASGDADAACVELASGDFQQGGWALGGSAVHAGNFVVMLTDAVMSQGGLTWHPVDLAPMRSFRASFTLSVTTTDVAPADGVTFFWSSDAPPLLGHNGNDLGFCEGMDAGGVNGGAVALATNLLPPGSTGVPSSNVSVKHNQPGSCVNDGPVTTTTPLAALNAGTITTAIVISVDGPAHSITVRRDGMTIINQQVLTYVPAQIKSIGFTAATGNNYAMQEIKDFTLTSCP